MTAITLEAVKAKQSELAEMIAKFEAQAAITTVLTVQEASIELRPGEHYAGAVLDESGAVAHHLVLMAEKPAGKLDWNDAMSWAKSIGGDLPSRQEQALLFTNCRPHIEDSWHWSNQQHEEDASYAWFCYFLSGNQSYDLKSYVGSARAVRRV